MAEDLSRFEYLYRDAGNYKIWSDVVLRGKCGDDERTRVRSALMSEEFFIPEQVGLQSLQNRMEIYGDVPIADDHVWHEFVDLQPIASLSPDISSIHEPLESFIRRFEAIETWDESRSPIYDELSAPWLLEIRQLG